MQNKKAVPVKRYGIFCSLCVKVILYKSLQKLISVDPADKAAGIIIIRYIRRIRGNNISNYLINWIITLFN